MLQSHVDAVLKLQMGDALEQKASSVCACGRRGSDDESWEIEGAYNVDCYGGFWSVEWNFVVHERTWLQMLYLGF